MIIDEDDDENVYSNDVDMLIRQELIEAHSKSNSVKPRNLKKSFIKRYRKFSLQFQSFLDQTLLFLFSNFRTIFAYWLSGNFLHPSSLVPK